MPSCRSRRSPRWRWALRFRRPRPHRAQGHLHPRRRAARSARASRARGNSTIVVRDGKVAEVRDGFVAPEAGATLVDLSDKFVLPGLIDLHVHLYIGGDPLRQRLDALDPRRRRRVGARRRRRAARTLMAGFTTVRDLGGDPRGIRALRDAIERGDDQGPTIVNAGADDLGHRRPRRRPQRAGRGLRRCRRARIRSTPATAPTIAAARRASRSGSARWSSSSPRPAACCPTSRAGSAAQMTPEEMKAIVETAHSFGRKVAAHSHAAEGTAAALEAGVDTIEHGSFLDDETIALFKATAPSWSRPRSRRSPRSPGARRRAARRRRSPRPRPRPRRCTRATSAPIAPA